MDLSSQKFPRILVTENDEVLKRFYQHALQTHCEDLVVTGSVKEALSHLQMGNFAFLITDLKLPGESGLDLIHCAVAKNPLIQILVASGFINDTHFRQTTESIPNVKGYLEKPFTVTHLVEKIQAIIEERQRQAL